MKLVDPNLEKLTWKPSQVGLTIGDAAPTNYGYELHFAGLEFFIENTIPTFKTPSWLGAISRPLPVTYSNLALCFDLMVDGFASWARCLEFDVRVALDKLGYNCSGQLNQATGSWQISDKNGLWVDSGFKPKPLSPWQWHNFRIEYHFNFRAKTYEQVSIAIDGSRYSIPQALQGLPATPLAWDDSCNVQVQQGINGTVPASFSQVITNMNLEWTA